MRKTLFILLSFIFACLTGCKKNTIDLSGEWRFAMDPENVGINEGWYNTTLSDRVSLPGSMLTNGKGNAVDINTSWTGDIQDHSLWHDSLYAPYRDPDNFKIPS